MSKNTLFIEKGAIVKFLANLESGDKRLTSWVICSGDKYNENHIVTKKEQIGTLFSYCFDQYGQYTIASYGKTEDINENSIKKIEIIDPQLIEIICTSGGKMVDGKLSVKRGAIVHFEMMYKGEKVKLKKYRIIVKLKKNDKRGDVGRVDSGVFEYNAKHLDDGKPTEYIVSVEEPKKDNNGIIYQSIEMVVIPDKEEQKQTETPNIEENKILKYDISELPEFGKLITFSIKKNEKYVNFPKKLSELDVHWEVTKDGKFMKGDIGFLFCYSFQEEGNFQVRCYICDKEIEAKEEYNIIQPKIFPKSAKWVDRDGTSGNIIETAGYYQKIYAYIEHEMLQEEKVSLYIYDKETDQLLHTEEGIRVTHKKNICIPFMLKKDPNIPTKETIQIYFKIKAENTDKLSIKNSEDKIEKYLTITNRGDVVDAYFCDADDTKIYRAIEEGTVKNLHFKLYMTNMLKREVEILFYIFKPFPTTIPAKDCLNWVHWEKIASHFSKKQPFHTTKAIVNNKGEILVEVPTSKLMRIGDFTSVVAVFKIMGSDGKVKGAYLERRNALMLFSNKALTHIEENFAPVKVLLKKVNNKVLRQEIGESESVLDEMKEFVDKHIKYSQKGIRNSMSEEGLRELDCSETVAVYLYKLGIIPNMKSLSTAVMTNEKSFRKAIGNENIDFVLGSEKSDFRPQRGDIFVWRHKYPEETRGHTGIVYEYDEVNDIVTILEAIGKGGSAEEKIHKGNGGYIGKGCTRTSFYKRDGKALASHLGWIGYFRPKNYLKKL